MISGIYAILHAATGRIYIGSSADIPKRFVQHRYRLGRGKHENRYLQNAWLKYGPGAFEFSVLEEVADLNLLIAREQAHLDGCTAPRFNIGACAWPARLGVKNTREHNARASAALKGRVFSEAHRQAMSVARAGWKPTPEHLEKLIASNRGRKQSPEHIAKVRATHLGKKRSPEALVRMRAAFARRPKHLSAETCAKMSAAKSLPRPQRRGEKRSPEAHAAWLAANVGKKRSPESRARMAAAACLAWARRKQLEGADAVSL